MTPELDLPEHVGTLVDTPFESGAVDGPSPSNHTTSGERGLETLSAPSAVAQLSSGFVTLRSKHCGRQPAHLARIASAADNTGMARQVGKPRAMHLGRLRIAIAASTYILLATACHGFANQDVLADISAEPLELPEIVGAGQIEQTGLRLSDFEAMALSSHPRIAEAVARVRAARGHCQQVGLPPNPTAGYVATEVGNEGRAGQQGVYVGQQFVRGNKLALNRSVACREVERLQQELAVQRIRVLTEVRLAFVEVFVAQSEVELTARLLEASRQATESVQNLVRAQEATRTDLLQAEIEARRITARQLQANARLLATWRRLAAAVAQPRMQKQRVSFEPSQLAWGLSWEQSLAQLLSSSPEVSSALAELRRAQAALRRARVEPISDINAQLSVQYDDATQDTVASVQVGAPLPLWNRNQGGIARSAHEVTAARRRFDAVTLRLTQDLATTFQQYEAAQANAEAYREGILERAEENMGLVKQAFSAGEASFLDLLTVQRTYFESNLDYLQALREVNQSVQLLNGFLLRLDDD